MSAARVLLIDIETSPNVGYTWGKYDQTVIEPLRGWELLSFAYKELGRGKAKCVARPDFRDKTEASLVKAVWKILNAADVIVAHNGDRFDLPKLRAKFVEHGLPPTTPFKTIDTKKIAKAHFGFYSNSLNDIARDLGLGQKLQTGGFELWKGCIAGNPASWRRMRRYNIWDVILLEKVYQKLKSWYSSHPNLALYGGEGDKPECPVCESTKVQRRGYRVMLVRRAARFHCQRCGHWFSRALSRAEKNS
jgi:hypothetical protein